MKGYAIQPYLLFILYVYQNFPAGHCCVNDFASGKYRFYYFKTLNFGVLVSTLLKIRFEIVGSNRDRTWDRKEEKDQRGEGQVQVKDVKEQGEDRNDQEKNRKDQGKNWKAQIKE